MACLLTGHLIYASNATPAATSHLEQPVFAGNLQTGSYVIVNASGNVGRATVVGVAWSRDSTGGVYAPVTERGTLVVDDVIVSCYAEFASHATAHTSMSPLRYAYYINELMGRWLPLHHADTDGVHWYAALLRLVAKTVVPQQFWWSTA